MDDDISDLKAGDFVVVIGRYGADYRIAKVDRVTPTQAVIGAAKYRLDGGGLVGGRGRSNTSISRAQHLFEKAKKKRAEDGLRDIFQFTRAGVEKARKAADYAENILRQIGQWEQEP